MRNDKINNLIEAVGIFGVGTYLPLQGGFVLIPAEQAQRITNALAALDKIDLKPNACPACVVAELKAVCRRVGVQNVDELFNNTYRDQVVGQHTVTITRQQYEALRAAKPKSIIPMVAPSAVLQAFEDISTEMESTANQIPPSTDPHSA